jgi:hypothetical protein
MKRLYNEYLALSGEGKELSTGTRIIAKDLVLICERNDLDLRDAQLVAIHEIDVLFSEAILKRAMKRRKESP